MASGRNTRWRHQAKPVCHAWGRKVVHLIIHYDARFGIEDARPKDQVYSRGQSNCHALLVNNGGVALQTKMNTSQIMNRTGHLQCHDPWWYRIPGRNIPVGVFDPVQIKTSKDTITQNQKVNIRQWYSKQSTQQTLESVFHQFVLYRWDIWDHKFSSWIEFDESIYSFWTEELTVQQIQISVFQPVYEQSMHQG